MGSAAVIGDERAGWASVEGVEEHAEGEGAGLMNGVRLMVVGNSLEAETICGLLRTEGIACDHRHTDVGAGAGDAIGDSGPREILVARDDLESARQLVTTDAS